MVEVYVHKLHSNSDPDVFTLVLKELNGENEIPVNIGKYEARNLLTILKNSHQIKPTTHQLFTEFISNTNVKLLKVIIVFYSINLDLFTSVIYFEKENGEQFTLNSRLSDAVALAISNNASIYCEESVIEKVLFNKKEAIFNLDPNLSSNKISIEYYKHPLSNNFDYEEEIDNIDKNKDIDNVDKNKDIDNIDKNNDIDNIDKNNDIDNIDKNKDIDNIDKVKKDNKIAEQHKINKENIIDKRFYNLTLEELNDKINLAIKNEDYNLAAKYRDQRNKLNNYENKK